MSADRVLDVLVVGAGPAGSALAIDLLRRGLSVRIIDKAPHSFEGSRAKGVQPRTLEVLEDLGAGAAVVAGGAAYPKLGIHLGRLVIPWRMYKNSRPTADVPYPNTWLVPQFRTDEALHARLAELGCRVEYGTDLIGLTQGPTMVTASLASAAGTEEARARYIVGADGGASTVRAQLGIDFLGETDEQDRILIIDAVTDGLTADRWHVWPGGRGRFVGACPLPGSELFQWMIRLAPGEDVPEELADVNRRIETRTRDPRIKLRDIRWRSVFRPNIRLAASYRQGRAFLVGDAAHVHTPAGAQGLNTGIQDAYNLGWKLGQVLAGADDRLLDTYEGERQPIAAGVLGLSTRKYQALGRLDTSSIKRGTDEQQLSLSYRGGPLAANGDRTARLHVGDRAPDALLADSAGESIRLFDVLRGPHFTAIAYGDGAARVVAGLDWPAGGAPLKTIVIDAGSPGANVVLVDRAKTFRQAYGTNDDTLFLIRPDGYLGAIADPEDVTADQVASSMRAMTAQ